MTCSRDVRFNAIGSPPSSSGAGVKTSLRLSSARKSRGSPYRRPRRQIRTNFFTPDIGAGAGLYRRLHRSDQLRRRQQVGQILAQT